MDTVQKLFRFLDESPTCYHAAANAKAALTAAGAVELRESEQWKLEKGTLYVVERGDSALVAFRVPEGPFHGFLMAAAHSDSPTFKVRETAEAASAGNTLRLSVEPYGGGVWRGWLDRPLSVAGRVVIRQGDRLVSRLVNIDRDLLVIPGVAIHMDRSVNKGAELNPAVDLLPLLGCGKEPGAFRKLIAEAAGVREEHLLSTELFLYPRTKAVQTGLNGEFIVSPRLDDLQCVFGCLEGFLAAKPGGSLPVLAVFNNEEVGSNTRQGADSTFLTDVLERIAHGCGLDSEAWKAAVANSFMVSADNAHAIHPDHPEYADKGECPVLGGGIVINHKIYSGAHGVGSELGHMTVQCEGRKCTCGSVGCWEQYSSATALIRQGREAVEGHPESLILKKVNGDASKIEARTIIDAAREGDPIACQVYDKYIYYLAIGIVAIINAFDPEVIVLGGGVSKAGDFLLEPLRKKVAEYVFYKDLPYAEIKIATLGNDAGIIGAAMLGK